MDKLYWKKFNFQSIKYWMIKLKKKLHKRITKIVIKIIKIEIKIQNKCDIWLKGEIKKKNKFSKRTKNNQKNEGQN